MDNLALWSHMHSGLCNKAHNVPPGPRHLLHSCTTMVPSPHCHVIRFHYKRCGMYTSGMTSLALPHGFPIRWVPLEINDGRVPRQGGQSHGTRQDTVWHCHSTSV